MMPLVIWRNVQIKSEDMMRIVLSLAILFILELIFFEIII